MQNPEERPESVFARRMREVRDERAVSQASLAAVMAADGGPRLDSTAITRMERGSRAVRLDEAVAVARALDVPLDSLLRPETPLGEQLTRATKDVEDADRRHLLATAERAGAVDRFRRLRQMCAHGVSPDELVSLGELGVLNGRSYSLDELAEKETAVKARRGGREADGGEHQQEA